MDDLKFVIESSEAQTLANKLGLKSVVHLLPLIAKSAKKLARPPISGFPVAAVGLATDGRIFIGVNVEFPGLPLHHSIHAEQCLITNLSLHPQTHLKNVVVSAYPCGHCRQFLQEIRGAPDIQIFVLDKNDDQESESEQINGYPDEESDWFRPLSCFLPNRFGPHDLLDKTVPLILETINNNLVLDDGKIVEMGNLCNVVSRFEVGELVSAAFEAANRSHAPYSGSPSGVALVDVNGKFYKGCYMESAAFNPSIGPVQAAMIAFITAVDGGFGTGGCDVGADYERIVGAVLVEVEGAVVRQEETARLFLNAVIPKCEFRVLRCQKSSSAKTAKE
ncbi:cytidine deaminase 1-like [Chenopodium quinoa]|uniref:cytidine deaminase n=1 Tax=Chenopodium quinoa TaxID=63459 RepID=A0A803MDE1_CHEQI|nr:cytidine deaminase 1-like [Chenopodium quinoa]